jgi:hypothetical protein
MTCRELGNGIETGVSMRPWDEPGGKPVYWPGGVRHGGGVSLVCGFCREHGKACADTGSGGFERESADRLKPGGVEYRCGVRRRTGS